MLIAQLPETDWIGKGVHTVGQAIFVPVFFVMVGVQADLHSVSAAPLLVLGLTFIAVLTKAAGAGFGARLAGLPWQEGNAVGAGMIARGGSPCHGNPGPVERTAHPDMFTVVIVMTVATTILTPLLLRFTLKTRPPRTAIPPSAELTQNYLKPDEKRPKAKTPNSSQFPKFVAKNQEVVWTLP